MTAIERTSAVRNLLSAQLPPILSAAGLDDFDEYLNQSPLRATDKEICVYIDQHSDDETAETFIIIIQVQIYGQDKGQEYHSVLMDFLRSKLVGAIVGMQQRESLVAELWPIDYNSSTSFIFYTAEFSQSLDDCRGEAEESDENN